MLQHVTVCCSVLQYVAECCRVLPSILILQIRDIPGKIVSTSVSLIRMNGNMRVSDKRAAQGEEAQEYRLQCVALC